MLTALYLLTVLALGVALARARWRLRAARAKLEELRARVHANETQQATEKLCR